MVGASVRSSQDFVFQLRFEFRHVRVFENEIAHTLRKLKCKAYSLHVATNAPRLQQISSGRVFHILTFGDNIQAVCGQSTDVPRPVVLVAPQRKVFDTLHGLTHPGTQAFFSLIMKVFIFNGIKKMGSMLTMLA